jgi:hypothetical protein
VYQGAPRSIWIDEVHVCVVGAEVVMVKVAVPLLAPEIVTGVVEPKLNVGGSTAPVGLVASAAVSAIGPVNPPDGVSVMVEVFPVAAPGATETAVPATAKLGGTVIVYCAEAAPLSV